MTPQEFIQKWGPGGPAFALNERQGAQAHFMDLCALLDLPTPGSQTNAQGDYIFEQDTLVLGQARGYADVFKRDCFAWENKAPGRSLDEALKQLLTYSLALANPPLLVVCDRLTIRIHTQFNGHPSVTHTLTLNDLALPEKRGLLRRVWTDPESFRPKITSRDITEAAAKSFATLAEQLRNRGKKPDGSGGTHPDAVAHFLTQCLFCFFAEDVGLLPGRMFERLVTNRQITSQRLCEGLNQLFEAMRSGGMFGSDDIPWFNGGLFKIIAVPKLEILDITELRNAAHLNWSAIDVSIFGTLFERGLDPAKRSQLGAHYTDPATIMRLVVPVLQRPLLQLWEREKIALQALMTKVVRRDDKHHRAAKARFVLWLEQLKNYRLLDPACGSGNFLFLGLKALKDIEHQSHIEAAALGLDREADLVTGPHNVLGIELNEYATELARATVWIGELQWRLAHGYEFKTNPVLEPLDNIECRDALLTFLPPASSVRPESPSVRPELPVLSAVEWVEGEGLPAGSATAEAWAAQRPGAHTLRFLKSPPSSAPPAPLNEVRGADGATTAVEATWPKASVVIGNPPFLGGSKKRGELGTEYFHALNSVYSDAVPGFGDLVCYWFAKALKAIESNSLGAAGLVATNSIRGGANRKVLDAIVERTHIFEAWSDEAWVNEGAAVRVSLVCFGHAGGATLDGEKVDAIDASLTSTAGFNASAACQLPESSGMAFEGTKKYGSFEIQGQLARDWLQQPNPHGKSNALVVRPWSNGMDVTKRPQDYWIVDFGVSTTEVEASMFEKPFEHIQRHVKATRNDAKWWLHERPRPQLRAALAGLTRFILTVRVSKFRLFVWRSGGGIPDTATVAIARADDTTFGILHSRFHELWSLRMGTSLEDRPRYTPSTCFETFPFPTGLTPADTAHQRTEQLEDGALIPADLADKQIEARVGRRTGVISKSEAYEPPASAPPTSGADHDSAMPLTPSTSSGRTDGISVRAAAINIARAAHRLNALRESWLNPPEWTRRVPEVIPLGMDHSPYPDRIEALPGHEKELSERTLTKLYNQRPAWLDAAHETLDAAVAAAYGWADYTPAMTDEEILKRLLALNLERSATIQRD